MFGEYALYVDEKVVGFLCDNRTLLKPTEAGRAFFETPEVGYPYPGSKDYWVADEVVEEAPRFQDLLRATASELPPPKPKKAKAPRAASEARRSQ
jgi:TfoX/Sxy family transcriptional regulator of competence genes